MTRKKYSEKQIEFIRKHAPFSNRIDLTKKFNQEFDCDVDVKRMKSLMSNYQIKIGIRDSSKVRRLLNREQEKFVLEHYIGVVNKDLCNMINQKFGTNFSPQQIKSYKSNRGLNSGITGYFEKGHVPINKGTKGMFNVGGNSGSFKKGQKPKNMVSIGTEVIKGDGYLWTKTEDNPPKWKQSHILLWEKVNGKLPEGMVLTFLDGNKENITIENLFLITRKEHLRLNNQEYRSKNPELTKAGIGLIRLKSKLVSNQECSNNQQKPRKEIKI